MRALDMCKWWLIGCRKLIVETEAKYIKGMLSNPSLGPNATINRWIDEILMFHFVLKHVPGKTFGPDGLSCHDRREGDENFPNPEDNYDDPQGLAGFEIPDDNAEKPLYFEDFKYDINTRGGYMLNLPTSIDNYQEELMDAR